MGKRGTKPKFDLRPYVYSRTTKKHGERWSANVRGAYDARTFLGSKFTSEAEALEACRQFIATGKKPPKPAPKQPRRPKPREPRPRPKAAPLERKTTPEKTTPLERKPAVSWRSIHARVYGS